MSTATRLRGLVIRDLAHTSLACPSQWEGQLADGRPLYIRYRWGNLQVRLGVEGEEMFTLAVPGARDIDGFMELDDVLNHTGLTLAEDLVVDECWDSL